MRETRYLSLSCGWRQIHYNALRFGNKLEMTLTRQIARGQHALRL
jgi:hypothetical protein